MRFFESFFQFSSHLYFRVYFSRQQLSVWTRGAGPSIPQGDHVAWDQAPRPWRVDQVLQCLDWKSEIHSSSRKAFDLRCEGRLGATLQPGIIMIHYYITFTVILQHMFDHILPCNLLNPHYRKLQHRFRERKTLSWRKIAKGFFLAKMSVLDIRILINNHIISIHFV